MSGGGSSLNGEEWAHSLTSLVLWGLPTRTWQIASNEYWRQRRLQGHVPQLSSHITWRRRSTFITVKRLMDFVSETPKIIRLIGPLAPFRQYGGAKHHNSAFPRWHFFSASMAAIASLRVPLVASIRAQSLNSCPYARLAAQLQSRLPTTLPTRTGVRSFRTSTACA